jgi:hypothetical protein
VTLDWRVDVRAVHRAMHGLTGPAPALLAGLADAEKIARLVSELPGELTLVEFSPFAALPREPGGRPDAPARPPRRARDVPPSWPPGTERRPVHEPAAIIEASSALGVVPSNTPGTPAGARAAGVPVFPLRPRADHASAPSGSAANPRGLQDAEPIAWPSPEASPPSTTLPSVGAARRRAAPIAREAPALDAWVASTEHEAARASGSPSATTSWRSWARIDREEADQRRTAWRPHPTLGASTPAAPRVRSGPSTDPPALGVPVESTPEERRPAPTGVVLLAALADAALANTRNGLDGSESMAPRSESPAVAMPPTKPRLVPPDVRPEAAAPPTPKPGLGDEAIGPAAALDPRLLASLVNDVLVEQARRHGVDLS